MKIYKYAVVETDPIEVTTFKVRFGSWPTTSSRISGPVKDRRNYQWYAIRKGAVDWAGTPPSRSRFALAQLSTQIAAEVLPIIYGCNRFLFDNISDMNTFFLELGTSRQYVQKIRVQDPCGWNTGLHDYGRVLMSLWTAMNLKHISFNCLCVGTIVSPGGDRIQIDTFFKRIMPFLRHWHEENEASTGGSRVLELVQFIDHPQCIKCLGKSRICRQDIGTRSAHVYGNFRRMVAWELGLGLP